MIFRHVVIHLLARGKWLMTVFARVHETVGKVDVLNVVDQIGLLGTLFVAKSALIYVESRVVDRVILQYHGATYKK